MTAAPDLITPDKARVAACQANPERGPRILFLSGGSALRKASRKLTAYTHRSIHLITPFDSGGSSAALRKTFAMPSVGDIRNRLLALASPDPMTRRACSLLGLRLPTDGAPDELRQRLETWTGEHREALSELPRPLRQGIQEALNDIVGRLPTTFDLRGASLGNLVLTASFLRHDRNLPAAVEQLRSLLGVRGQVCPTSEADAQLAARLADGSVVVGQHLLTGKEVPPLTSTIAELWLADTDGNPTDVPAAPRALELLAEADLICFPIGSFFSSLIANLLPVGIATAIRANPCPKIYIPNPATDPEQIGMTTADAVAVLLETLRRETGPSTPTQELLNTVIMDRQHGGSLAEIADLGPQVQFADLVGGPGAHYFDPTRLDELITSLATDHSAAYPPDRID